jgi:Ca2+-binding EF-hand superfamily protein
MITTTKRFVSFCAVALGTLVVAQSLQGQPPGAERRERGGGRGGPEAGRGGPEGGRGGPEAMRGGPPGGGMWGGPPGGGMGGGPPGGGMMGGPMDFLARMDVNGNGMLDPEETQGRARMFLERTGLDLTRPIPLDQVAKAFEEMRNRRMEEMGGGPQRGGRDRGEERGGDRGEEEPRLREMQPLVPGFGEPDLFDPVPGFGDLGERFAVKIEDEDMQEAQRTLARYDANQDGVLDADEIRNARWREDPLMTDRNRDGRLTLTELALRYAIRRVENEEQPAGARTANRAGGGRATAPNARGAAERPGREAREDNRGGERGGERGGQARERWFTRREGQGEGNAPEQESRPMLAAANGRSSYRMMSPAERLATYEGLPDWFARLDATGDGQVSMAEYAMNWSDEVVADFAQFDLNGDGIITAEECLLAVEGGAVQGMPSAGAVATREARNGDGAAGRSHGRTSARGEASAPEAAGGSARAAAAPRSQSGGDAISDRYVKYAVDMIKKYDTNGDGVLTEDEWSKMNRDYSFADTDGDGRITPHELAAAFNQR